jgi:hypothetical protein
MLRSDTLSGMNPEHLRELRALRAPPLPHQLIEKLFADHGDIYHASAMCINSSALAGRLPLLDLRMSEPGESI